MDKKESVEERIQTLIEATQAKNYRGRKMVVTIDSHTDDLKNYVVNGTLQLSVSETPEKEDSWTEKEFEVMIMDKDVDQAVAYVFAHLNSIPIEYGDMIFEDNFTEILKLVEESGGQASISPSQTPL